ncbi:MAG: hypothetical protein J6K36_05480 [Bacilli bacterium]|nr:hypothetical protein [Bacilli bacterium]
MDKQLKKIYLYMGIFVALIFIGATYAFFTAGMSSETSTTVRADAGTMKITYSGGANIDLAGIYPKDDVWATKTITVTGNNTTDADMYYKLTLVVDSNTFKTDDPLQYELVSTNTSTNGEIIPNISKTDITGTSIELGSGKFKKANNAKHTYLLKIYYPKKATSQNANQGAAFSAHVEITSVKVPRTNGKLSELVLYNNEVKAPITTPGAAISTASEALLASAEDDNGTSYYFRGAVTNNYVEFASKCWRIVRIGGDGSVKLILHNDNTIGAANPCDAANNSEDAAFARYSGTTYASAFNTNYNDNAYIGFKYGTPGSSTYEATHANTNNSTILTNLEAWYNNNLKTYESVIADTVWCNDKTNLTDTTYNPFRWSNVNGLGYGTNKTFYGATKRLLGTSGSAGGTGPSLKCNGELSKITSKVGLITADELAFAGYAAFLENTTTYLQENATDTHTFWWSLSPYGFYGSFAAVWFVGGSDGGFSNIDVSNTLGVRPSISLKSTTNVTGDGTSDKPFVVD